MKSKTIKRMVIMLICVGLLFGGIFGYKAFVAHMIQKAMRNRQAPPVSVSAITAEKQAWQPHLEAVGTLLASEGVDVTTEIAGLVRSIHFKSGDDVQKGQILVQLNADTDKAQLHALEADAELARRTYERDSRQFAVKAISQANLDVSLADMKSRQAQVAQQAAVVDKKTIRAPFSGRLGITDVNLGQYLNPGYQIVTLQSIDSLFVDFFLPQQSIARIAVGQTVIVTSDTYPGRRFEGPITAINPEVDPGTRNIKVEATLSNPKHELLPGMFVVVQVQAGAPADYITLPQTAVAYNPYGETVFIVQAAGQGKPGKTVRQTFVTVGDTRGDQVAVLKGIQPGDQVVTSGQLKLRNGSSVVINNTVQPSNNANPQPMDQ